MRRKANKINIELRRDAVVRNMRDRRLSLREITSKLEVDGFTVSHTTVSRDMSAIIKEWREQRYKDLTAEVLKDVALLDDIISVLYESIMAGNYSDVHGMVHVLERRAKLLGLDGPARATLSLDLQQSPTPKETPLERARALAMALRELAQESKSDDTAEESRHA